MCNYLLEVHADPANSLRCFPHDKSATFFLKKMIVLFGKLNHDLFLIIFNTVLVLEGPLQFESGQGVGGGAGAIWRRRRRSGDLRKFF